MPDVMLFDILDDVHPQAAFIAAGASIYFRDEVIDGRLFLAERRGAVAACAKIKNVYLPGVGQLADKVRQGKISARVEIEEHNGCSLVSKLWLTCQGGSRAWVCGAHRSQLFGEAHEWWANVTIAGMSGRTRDALPVVYAARPHGDREPTTINLRGNIGGGKRTADYVSAYLGRPEHAQTVVVNIDSVGGSLDESIKIYRLLAEWPCAVYANIERRAYSGAALVALAADVRIIRPDGQMMLHQPNISFDAGEQYEVKDLLKIVGSMLKGTKAIINLVAVSTGNSIEDAGVWCMDETIFNAGESLGAGLVHEIAADAVPDKPRALRARFAPIDAPFQAARSAFR